MDARSAPPSPATPPSRLLGALEPLRTVIELGSLLSAAPFLLSAPRGSGEHVVALPGFGGSDDSTLILRQYLARMGFTARGWSLGRNTGFSGMTRALDRLLDRAVNDAGEPVSLVGWSLGGTMARRLARLHPEKVRSIIMLGSPITGSPASTSLLRGIDRIEPGLSRSMDRHYREQGLLDPPGDVPTSSVYSRTDGVVSWRISREVEGPRRENIEVVGSHIGLGFNPLVLYTIADRLAQDPEAWQPFSEPWFARPLLRAA